MFIRASYFFVSFQCAMTSNLFHLLSIALNIFIINHVIGSYIISSNKANIQRVLRMTRNSLHSFHSVLFVKCTVSFQGKPGSCFQCLPLPVSHHSSTSALSNVSEQSAGRGLLLAFTIRMRITDAHTHKQRYTHIHT